MPPRKKVEPSAGEHAWAKRRRDATYALMEDASSVGPMFYASDAPPDARERPDAAFLMRLAYVATPMAAEWVWSASLLDEATVATADRRSDFVHRINAAWDECDTLLRLVAQAREPTAEDWPARVLEATERMESALLGVIGLMVAPADFDSARSWYESFDSSPLSPTLFLQAHREVVKVLAEVMALRRALLRISGKQSSAPASGPVSDAERARRYRARKRRRVAFQIQFDVYDDDIELLRRYGLLTLPEKTDRDAVSDALDALLVHAFVTYPHVRFPWRERIARQRGRIKAVHEREKSEDDE